MVPQPSRARCVLASLVAFAILAGCASSSSSYYKRRNSISNVQLCRTVNSKEARSKPGFRADVVHDLQRRNLTPQICADLIRRQNIAIAAGIAAAAAVVAISQSDGGGGGGAAPATSYSAQDYAWDWDQFYNQYGVLIWRCRGIQSGRFAEDSKCYGRVKTDLRWPAKTAP